MRNPAEEGEGPVVAVQPSLRRRRRVSRDEARIAVRKRHGKKMRPPLDPGNDRIRLAKVRLGIARRMRQRHKHLPETTPPFPDVILDDGLSTRKAMLVAKPLKYPLRRVPLLAVNRSVRFQNTLNDIRERIQLRALRWLVAAVARGLRMPEHLLYRLSRNAKPTRRISLAQTINMACQTDAEIKLHRIHPPTFHPEKGPKATGGRVLLRPRLGKSRRLRGLICHRRLQFGS